MVNHSANPLVAAVVLLLIGSATACDHIPPDPAFKLRAIRAAVAEYHQRVGELPATLEHICLFDSSLCRLEPAETWLRDAWGTKVQFQSLGHTFRVASGGPDRRVGTVDDLMLDASFDSTTAAGLAGCYELREPPSRLGTPRLHLATRVVRSGGYEVRAPVEIGGDSAFIAEWYPLAKDSLLARWIRSGRGVELRAQVRDGQLVGRASGRAIEGRRVACD